MLSASDNTHPPLLAPRFHPFARLLFATIGALAITFLILFVIVLATSAAATLLGQNADTQVEQFFSKNLLLANLLVYPPVLLWLWFCRRFFDRRTFVSIGLRAPGFFAQFCAGILCGFLGVALIFGVLWLSGNLQVRGLSLAAESGGWTKSLLLLGGWAFVMLCVGLFEEISFRGYAFHNLSAWLGTRTANVLQAIVFALIHLGNLSAQGKSTPEATLAAFLALPNIFLIGLFFTLCYLKTGSLWFPIAFHAAWNFFMGSVFSLPVSGLPIFQLFDVSVTGSTLLTGGEFGPEASLLLTPILLAMVFVASRTADSPQAIWDLQSLRLGEPEAEASAPALTEPETSPYAEARENRYRTRMGQRQAELDEETQRTIEQLNKERRKASTASLSTPAPFPAIVIPPAPAANEIERQTETVPTKVVSVEAKPIVSNPDASTSVENIPVESTPAPPAEEAAPEIVAPEVTVPSTPAPPKPKPAPRW